MPAWTYAPAAPTRGPCLVVPDIYGPSPFYQEITRRLAAAGHTATLVDYFFREGPLPEPTRDRAFARRARFDEQRALRDLDAALDDVAARADVPGRVGIVGFCLAGQFALDLCAVRADLTAVCFYPFPEGVGGDVVAAAPRPLDLADRIRGPVLAFWGREDYIPTAVIERFGAAMAATGADYTAHVYDGAGHGFLQGLVEDRADSPAAHDAWARTLRHLAPPEPRR